MMQTLPRNTLTTKEDGAYCKKMCTATGNKNSDLKQHQKWLHIIGTYIQENIIQEIKNGGGIFSVVADHCRGQGYDGAGNMADAIKGAASIIHSQYPKAIYFHYAPHKLNLGVVSSCKLSRVTTMMSHITALSNFFNYSTRRQECLESAVVNYPSIRKTKLIPLCRTPWVERLDALEDLLEAVVDTLVEKSVNFTGRWNRDTVAQATSLLKGIDFEFIITLGVTQKVLAFTSSITTGLQQKGIDLVNAYEDIQLVIRSLQHTRDRIEENHHRWFEYSSHLASKVNVEVKKPCTCQRPSFQQNHTTTRSHPPEQEAEDYIFSSESYHSFDR